jgi:hypothetical protein
MRSCGRLGFVSWAFFFNFFLSDKYMQKIKSYPFFWKKFFEKISPDGWRPVSTLRFRPRIAGVRKESFSLRRGVATIKNNTFSAGAEYFPALNRFKVWGKTF